MNMAGMNGGNGVMAGVPLMNNGMNGTTPRQGSEDEQEFEPRLNAYIYDYFIRNENWDCARALMNSNVSFAPPLRRDGDANGADDNNMQTDSKDDMDTKRPDGLPPTSISSEVQGPSFLLEWFVLFWEVFTAQRKMPKATPQASQYVQHTQNQSRLRAEQQQALLQGGMRQMMPGMDNQQMMRMQQAYGVPINGDLRKNAMNNRGNYNQPSAQQLQHMKQQQQLLQQQQMRRDPSDMDVNGQRPRTPSSGDNAPSPPKRPRLDGAPFNGQMIPNGKGGPLQGMQGQQMMDMNTSQANQILIRNGINPEQLSQSQFASFQAQNPQIQEKSIQVYAQNLARTQRQGMPRPGMGGQDSPMMQAGFDMGAPPVELYSQQMMRAAGGVPGGPNGANGGNHALQDYQMQLMLLEQQNKKRLLMARQEQDSVGRDGQPMPGGLGGFAQGMSPSGSRSGPSPEPGQMKRGTPKMGPAGLPTSPMPDGNMPQRSSPAAMGFAGQMPPDMYQNGMPVPPNGMRMAPSSHPGQFGGAPFGPAQAAHMEAQRQGRLPNGANWQQGPQGQAPPMLPPTQTQQPQPMDTPQRNAMPPPPAVQPGAATNGRPSPPTQAAAPPTPQPGNKANPKAKKDTKETRKRQTKKTSTTSVAATPSGEAEAPITPTPATPTIPQHPKSFNAGQNADAIGQPTVAQPPPAAAPTQGLAPPQPDMSNVMPQFGIDGPDGPYSMNFANLENADVLDNFDFDSFLQNNDDYPEFDNTVGFSLTNPAEGVETGAEGA